MGKEQQARELRRETKRTLGAHLQQFAENERARLVKVEAELAAEREARRVADGAQTTALARSMQIHAEDVEPLNRPFLGRLGWLVFGR